MVSQSQFLSYPHCMCVLLNLKLILVVVEGLALAHSVLLNLKLILAVVEGLALAHIQI